MLFITPITLLLLLPYPLHPPTNQMKKMTDGYFVPCVLPLCFLDVFALDDLENRTKVNHMIGLYNYMYLFHKFNKYMYKLISFNYI